MGLQVNMFCDEICQDLLCSICNQVLYDPMMLQCEHFYCKECLIIQLQSGVNGIAHCPVDWHPFNESSMRKPTVFLKMFLDGLRMKCVFYPKCYEIVTYKDIFSHQAECPHNPDNNLTCDNCSGPMTLATKRTHDCRVFYESRILQLRTQNAELKNQIEELKARKRQKQQNVSPPVPKNDNLFSSFFGQAASRPVSREACLRKLNFMIKAIQSYRCPADIGPEWKDGLFVKSILTLVEPNERVSEIFTQTNLQDFFYMKRFYGNTGQASNFKNNSSLFIHILLFDFFQPLIKESSKVLILDFIDHGLSQWIAQTAQLVTTAVHFPFYQKCVEANSRTELGAKINYVPYRRDIKHLKNEVDQYRHDYDFIIDFSLHSDSDIKYLMKKFCKHGKLIRFSREPFSLRIYSWKSGFGKGLSVDEILTEKDFISFRVAVPQIDD